MRVIKSQKRGWSNIHVKRKVSYAVTVLRLFKIFFCLAVSVKSPQRSISPHQGASTGKRRMPTSKPWSSEGPHGDRLFPDTAQECPNWSRESAPRLSRGPGEASESQRYYRPGTVPQEASPNSAGQLQAGRSQPALSHSAPTRQPQLVRLTQTTASPANSKGSTWGLSIGVSFSQSTARSGVSPPPLADTRGCVFLRAELSSPAPRHALFGSR